MNRWSKKNTVNTIKRRANYNARMLVRYVNDALALDYEDRELAKNMSEVYCYQLRECINMYEDFGIISWDKSTDLKEKIWNYYSKVFK